MNKRQKKKALLKCVDLNKPISVKLQLDEKDISREAILFLNRHLPIHCVKQVAL